MSLPDEISLDLSSLPSISSHALSTMDFSSTSSPSNNTKIVACIITFFPESEDNTLLLPSTWFPEGHYSHWCGQFEKCPKTDKLHGHIFVKFVYNYRKRFKQITDTISRVTGNHGNIQITKKVSQKSIQCAINYVLKPGGTGLPYIWNNTCAFDEAMWLARPTPKKSKEDKDKDKVDWIESKPKHWTWDQIVHESDESKYLLASCSWGKSYHAGRMATAERRTITNVIVFYGAGGTGKTTLARSWDSKPDESEFERYFKRNHDDGHFWGGGRVAYKGQRIIHFEEFDGNEQFSNMKEWMDIGKTGPPVNVKNGGTHLNHETVIITTNVHPAGWYRSLWTKDPKQFHPFWRRITKVCFFPEKRADGSLNIPSEDHEPYFIDQTDDWIALEGSHKNCLAHASKHWPLEDTTLDERGIRASSFPWP